MKQYIAAAGAGLLFGLGLVVSNMINPAKVLGFLDVTGNWDPSLAFVMGGAVLITAASFTFILKRPTTLLGGNFQLPTRSDISVKLVTGSALFGIGWGLVGLCPGPAITSLSLGYWQSWVFVTAMVIGGGAYLFTRRVTAAAAE
jgi:uncharacterized membrane protein YedE/YeeE